MFIDNLQRVSAKSEPSSGIFSEKKRTFMLNFLKTVAISKKKSTKRPPITEIQRTIHEIINVL